MKQKQKEFILYPVCSEYISKLGIKKSEIPYIKKRVKELFSDENDRKYLLEEFTNMIDKQDIPFDFINEDNVEPYNKISNELMAKREMVCLFCGEVQENLLGHIKEFHKEEIKIVLKCVDEEEFKKFKKEILLENL